MVDEIVLENKWKRPIYFSSTPWDSELKLRERTTVDGVLLRLDRQPDSSLVDINTSWDLFMNRYKYDGYQNSEVYRDENATGVFMGLGMSASRFFEELSRRNMVDSALMLAEKINEVYPEYWQMYVLRIEKLEKRGDTAKANQLLTQLHDTLTAFVESNPENVYYIQDLGLTKAEIGRRSGNQAMIEEGVRLLFHAFELYPNNSFGFRKLMTVLTQQGRYQEVRQVTEEFAKYKRNLEDPLVQRLLGITHPTGLPSDY
jgi:tetratricopeptide (TPR) repeat protein